MSIESRIQRLEQSIAPKHCGLADLIRASMEDPDAIERINRYGIDPELERLIMGAGGTK